MKPQHSCQCNAMFLSPFSANNVTALGLDWCSDAEAVGAITARCEGMQGLQETELLLHHPHSFPHRAITPVKVHC